MLSFRKKILFSDFILFLVFIALLFPFVGRTVSNIVTKSLEEKASELIHFLEKASEPQDLVERLKTDRLCVFFRISLIDENYQVLYESHIKEREEVNYPYRFQRDHPEIRKAFSKGKSYHEGMSKRLSQAFAYVLKAFEFQGQKYVLRTAFPLSEIKEMRNDFELGFISFGCIILLLYSLMTWVINHRLSSPIQKIINAIKPYQKSKQKLLPRIELEPAVILDEDFGQLAETLNSLSEKVENQFQDLVSQRNETKAILDALVEGVIAIDSKMRVIYVNKKACEVLQIPLDVILKENFIALQKNNSRFLKQCQSHLMSCIKNREISIKSCVLEFSQQVHIDLIGIPLEEGGLLVLQDKTSDYKMVQVGKDFIANASHELRTPITVIRGFAETLQNVPYLSKKMLSEITEKMIYTCERLNHLVKKLLTLADIENLDSSSFVKTDVAMLLENIKHMLLDRYENARIVIEMKKEDVYANVDPGLLELAIINLLENAVKYSNGVPEIFVTVDSKNQVVIEIEDHGIGIPLQDLDHIFTRFYTVDKARSRKKGGAGLGLSIVKTIIEKHKGMIKVRSQLGVGTTFTLKVPAFKSSKALQSV